MSDKNSNLVEYKVVFEESLDDLKREVSEAMRDGWIPLGGVSIAAVGEWERPYVFAQAMTRNRPSK